MSDNPELKVVVVSRHPFAELVRALREKLAQAECGELTAFAYVAEYSNGNVGHHAFHDLGSNVYKTIGAIEALKVRVIDRHVKTDPMSESEYLSDE